MIRCSSLPRIFACHASAEPPLINIDEESPFSIMGVACHRYMELHIKGENPEVSDIAEEYGIEDSDELGFLTYNCRQIWDKFKDLVEIVAIEEKFYDDILSGSPDLVGKLEDGTLLIFDWKSGYVERDYSDQVLGYACISAKRIEPTEKGKAIICYVRTGSWQVLEFTGNDLSEWKGRLQVILSDVNPTFTPGIQCDYCPHKLNCKAKEAYIRSAGNDIMLIENQVVTADQLAELYPKSRQLKKALDSYEKAFKESLAISDIKVDGGTYTLKEEERAKIMVSCDSVDLIKERLGLEGVGQSPDVFRINKTALGKAVMAQAGRGFKKQAKDSIMDELKDLGACEVSIIKKTTFIKETK